MPEKSFIDSESRRLIRKEIHSRLLEKAKRLPFDNGYASRIAKARSPESLRALYAEICEAEKAAMAAAEVNAEARTKHADPKSKKKVQQAEMRMRSGSESTEKAFISRVAELAQTPVEKQKTFERDYAKIAREINADPRKHVAFRAYLLENHQVLLGEEGGDIPEEVIQEYYAGFPSYYRDNFSNKFDKKANEAAASTLEDFSSKEKLDERAVLAAVAKARKTINKNLELRKEFGPAFEACARVLASNPGNKEAFKKMQEIASMAADRLAFQREVARLRFSSLPDASASPKAETGNAAPVEPVSAASEAATSSPDTEEAAKLKKEGRMQNTQQAWDWLAAEIAARTEYTGKNYRKILKKAEDIIAGDGTLEERLEALNNLGLEGSQLEAAVNFMFAREAASSEEPALAQDEESEAPLSGLARENIPELDPEDETEESTQPTPAVLTSNDEPPALEEEKKIPAKAELPLGKGLPEGWEKLPEVAALAEIRDEYASKYGEVRHLFKGKDALARSLELASDSAGDAGRKEAVRNFLISHDVLPVAAKEAFEAMEIRARYIEAKTALGQKLKDMRLKEIPADAPPEYIEKVMKLASAEIFELLILSESRELAARKVAAYTPEKKNAFTRFLGAAMEKGSSFFKENPKVASAARFLYIGSTTIIKASFFGWGQAIFAVGGRLALSGAILKTRNWYHKRHETELEGQKEEAMERLRRSMASDPSLDNIMRISRELERINRKVAWIGKVNAGAEIIAMGLIGFITGQGMREAQKALFDAGMWQNFSEFLLSKRAILPDGKSLHLLESQLRPELDPHKNIAKELKNLGLDKPSHMDPAITETKAAPATHQAMPKGHMAGPVETHRNLSAAEIEKYDHPETVSDPATEHDYPEAAPDAAMEHDYPQASTDGAVEHDYPEAASDAAMEHDYPGGIVPDTAPRPRVADISRSAHAYPVEPEYGRSLPHRHVPPGMMDIYEIPTPQVLREMQMFESQTHELAALEGISLKDFLQKTPPLELYNQGSSLGRQIANGLVRQVYKLPNGMTKEVVLTPRQAILRAFLEPYKNELRQRGLEDASLSEFLNSLL